MGSLDNSYLVPNEFHSFYRYPIGTMPATALHVGLLGQRYLFRYQQDAELCLLCHR
jgi:hypothetical protein